MKILKFETLKKKACDEFLYKFDRGYGFPNHASFLALAASLTQSTPTKPIVIMDEWRTYALNLINNWDIRMYKKLVECFPNCLPKNLIDKIATCDYNEKGDWVLIFD